MGTMTLAQFRDELEGALNRGTIDTVKKDRWLNNAMVEFGTAIEFPELATSAIFSMGGGIGTHSLAIPPTDYRVMHEDGVSIYSVSTGIGTGGVWQKLIPETRSRYRKNIGDYGDITQLALPRYYHIWDNKFWWRPAPDLGYLFDMSYWKKVTKMLVDTDVSMFREEWDDVILLGALYRGFRFFGEYDRYQNVKNDFLGMVRSRAMEMDLREFPLGGISLSTSESEEVLGD